MTVADPRFHPLIELDLQQLREMVAPVAEGASVREAVLLDGGLVNTVYQVTLTPGGASFVLRIYAPGSAAAIEAERRLLRELRAALPVPDMVYADPHGATAGHPYTVYRWVEGITLNEYRRGATALELAALGEPLGALLARIARHPPPRGLEARSVAGEVEQARGRLRAGLVRERLGEPLADRLESLLADRAGDPRLEGGCALVHGDFGGRNILVAADPEGPWRLNAVLDWDSTATGSPLWDVGSFFRYSHRYDEEFRARFEAGYRAGGGDLPGDWWRAARLVDASCIVTVLDDPRPLARVFAECRLLVVTLLDDFGVPE